MNPHHLKIKFFKKEKTEDCVKIFAIHIIDKGLMSLIYKELLDFNKKKIETNV